MSSEVKVRAIGARKAPEQISMSALVTFAERIIRTDKNAVLRAQNSVSDLNAPSNDSSNHSSSHSTEAPRVSALEELCGKTGSVKLKTNSNDEVDSDRVIDLTALRRKK
jgi:hypothetical protein